MILEVSSNLNDFVNGTKVQWFCTERYNDFLKGFAHLHKLNAQPAFKEQILQKISPQFCCWPWCYMVQNIPLVSWEISCPSWVHSHSLAHPQTTLWGSKVKKKCLDAVQALFVSRWNIKFFCWLNPILCDMHNTLCIMFQKQQKGKSGKSLLLLAAGPWIGKSCSWAFQPLAQPEALHPITVKKII